MRWAFAGRSPSVSDIDLLRWVVAAALLAVTVQPAASAQSKRMVFAHYMVTNQDYQGDSDPSQEAKITAYEREIQQAQAVGIDGFALNVGGWFKEPYYIRYSAQMFEAAYRLHSGFKLFFSDDMCCGNGLAEAEDMLRRFANNPRYSPVYFKHDGKLVISTFGDTIGPSGWETVRQDLASGAGSPPPVVANVLPEASVAPTLVPLQIFVVPAVFWGGELPARAAIQNGLDKYGDAIDGAFYWGIAGVPASHDALDQLRSSESYASTLHTAHKLFMAPVCLQFWGANANRYFEYSGFSGMRSMWIDAINTTHPAWIEIITWNDFIEGTYVSPIDDPNKYEHANYLNASGIPSDARSYFHSHSGATALLRYFIDWYKTGVQPQIHTDALYWAYRTQPLSMDVGTPPTAKKYGPLADVVYVTANLKSAATLTITSGRRVTTIKIPAGSTDVQAPFEAGSTPSFQLSRGGKTVITGVGSDPIEQSPKYNDFYYSTGTVLATH